MIRQKFRSCSKKNSWNRNLRVQRLSASIRRFSEISAAYETRKLLEYIATFVAIIEYKATAGCEGWVVETAFLDQLQSFERRCPRGIRLAGRCLPQFGGTDLRSSRTIGSLAAREAGLGLLAEVGATALLDQRPGGRAAFPQGYVGSIAHDSAFAVVALASHADVAAVGIDIEPATCLPSDCFETIATPRERGRVRDLVEARCCSARRKPCSRR